MSKKGGMAELKDAVHEDYRPSPAELLPKNFSRSLLYRLGHIQSELGNLRRDFDKHQEDDAVVHRQISVFVRGDGNGEKGAVHQIIEIRKWMRWQQRLLWIIATAGAGVAVMKVWETMFHK
jgi:hypothetical protein